MDLLDSSCFTPFIIWATGNLKNKYFSLYRLIGVIQTQHPISFWPPAKLDRVVFAILTAKHLVKTNKKCTSYFNEILKRTKSGLEKVDQSYFVYIWYQKTFDHLLVYIHISFLKKVRVSS